MRRLSRGCGVGVTSLPLPMCVIVQRETIALRRMNGEVAWLGVCRMCGEGERVFAHSPTAGAPPCCLAASTIALVQVRRACVEARVQAGPLGHGCSCRLLWLGQASQGQGAARQRRGSSHADRFRHPPTFIEPCSPHRRSTTSACHTCARGRSPLLIPLERQSGKRSWPPQQQTPKRG
jgi:hypothetical protein